MGIQNRVSWSVGLGQWGGVPVRLHMLFFVFAAITFYFGWYATDKEITSVGEYRTLTSLLILFASVILHELGHLYFVTRSQGRVHLIEILPWGGCSRFESPHSATDRLFVHIAGPVVNLLLCGVCGLLILMHAQSNGIKEIFAVMNPIRPVGLLDDDFGICVLKLGLWINWILFLINLIPVFPFDGGNILRSLASIVWRAATPRQAYLACLVFAQLAALSLFFAAWVLRDSNPNELIPTWFVLVLLGIIVFFSSKRQAALDDQHLAQIDLARLTHAPSFLIPESDAAYVDLDDPFDDDLVMSQWLQKHKIDRHSGYEPSSAGIDDGLTSEDEENLVDQILEKLHATGINSLSQREKKILQRVSARYREARKQKEV